MASGAPGRRAWAAAEGAALAIAAWCMLFALHLTPGPLHGIRGVMVLAALGALAGAVRPPRTFSFLLVPPAAVIAIVVFSPVSERLVGWWVRDDPLRAPGVAAVVVLSAGLNPDTTISSSALDHLLMGLELARAHEASLVTTSTRQRFPHGMVSGEVDQTRVLSLAGPHVPWVRADGGRTTRDEATSTAAVLFPLGVRQVAVVTSPMHTRRACAAFEAVGFVVTCVAARMRGSGAPPLSEVPDDRLAVFGEWVYEVTALAKYRWLGWVRSASGTPARYSAAEVKRNSRINADSRPAVWSRPR